MLIFNKLLILCCFCFLLQSVSSLNEVDKIEYPPMRQSSGSKIVGGENAAEGDAPYQCSLQNMQRHFCGCSIISNKFILTASHCLEHATAESVDVLVGTNDLKNGGKYYKSNRFVLHENYNKPMYAYDIALIEVNETIEFNSLVQPIEPALEDADMIPDYANLKLTGWGLQKVGGTASQLLQILKLKAVSTDKCRKSALGKHIHQSHVCAFIKVGQGACNGDSGGPLVHNNKVVGVVNFGLPCARGEPDAYAKVSYLHDWIKQNAKSISKS